MSFLKFWKGRSKGVSRSDASEDSETAHTNMTDHGEFEDADKRGRLKHSLSISRSGRYKAKKKERTGFLDKPDVFSGPDSELPSGHSGSPADASTGASRSPSSGQRGASSHRRNSSNPSSCRDGNQISSLRLQHPPTIQSQQPTAV